MFTPSTAAKSFASKEVLPRQCLTVRDAASDFGGDLFMKQHGLSYGDFAKARASHHPVLRRHA